MPGVKRPPRERQRHYMREWRKYLKLTQEQVAERVEIDNATLSRLERGAIPYNQDILEKIALAYGCDVEDLLSIDPLKPDPPRLIYNRLRKAPKHLQEQAARVIEALLKAG